MNKLPIACVAVAALLLTGCVSRQKYDELDQEYQQLEQSMGAEVGAQKMQISRLQNAVLVSVNSDLLFPSGAGRCPPTRSRPSPRSPQFWRRIRRPK